MSDTPVIAIGADELSDEYVGDNAICPNCHQLHEVQYGEEVRDGKKYPSKLLGFVKCGEKTFLVAIDEKILP